MLPSRAWLIKMKLLSLTLIIIIIIILIIIINSKTAINHPLNGDYKFKYEDMSNNFCNFWISALHSQLLGTTQIAEATTSTSSYITLPQLQLKVTPIKSQFKIEESNHHLSNSSRQRNKNPAFAAQLTTTPSHLLKRKWQKDWNPLQINQFRCFRTNDILAKFLHRITTVSSKIWQEEEEE